LRRPHKERAHA